MTQSHNPQRIDCVVPVGPGQQSWLGLALGSLLKQRGVQVNILVVLDKRQDVPDSMAEYLGHDNVQVLRNPTTKPGIGSALNLGLRSASTQLVARLDADDLSHPLRLTRQAQILTESVTLVSSREQVFFSDEDFQWKRVADDVANFSTITPRTVLSGNPIVHSSVLMRRDVVLKAGGYDERLRRIEDYDLWLRLYGQGEFRIVEEELVARRSHEGQFSRKSRPVSDWMRVSKAQIGLSRRSGQGTLLGMRAAISYIGRNAQASLRVRLGTDVGRSEDS